MSAAAAILADPAPAAPLAPAANDARLLIDEQLQMLRRVAQAGLEMTLEIERQVQGEVPEGQAPSSLGDLALAYSRASRALRLTVMLQSRLAGEREATGARSGPADGAEAAAEEARRSDPRYVHKARVERIVERVAKAAVGEDEEELDRLVIEAGERLDDEDLYGEVLDRPVGELVALVCRDLGLDPDWTRLGQEAWARAELASGVANSPFLMLLDPKRPLPRAGEGDRPP
jgi:hypothetical protein